MNNYKYLLFDLDGTVTDSGPGIMNAAAYALKSYGIVEKDPDRLRLFVGPPLDASFIERYSFSKEKAPEAIAKFREYYNVTGIFENSVYPGYEELLKELKDNGHILAIASSKPQVMIYRVLEHFDIQKYFDVIVGCELDGRRSQKSEVIDEVLKQLSELESKASQSPVTVSDIKKKAVMIGDREYDVKGARAFDLPCVGVTYGYGTRAELEAAGADYIADTTDDLKKIL
ncbi:MAG: HAD hydrolase-like protein [Butyrivibrio sp.]|nr:HAD hydrolase-like protein [Butyrivibrio sp.]